MTWRTPQFHAAVLVYYGIESNLIMLTHKSRLFVQMYMCTGSKADLAFISRHDVTDIMRLDKWKQNIDIPSHRKWTNGTYLSLLSGLINHFSNIQLKLNKQGNFL